MLESEIRGIRYTTLLSFVSAMGGFLFGYETVVIAGTIGLVRAQYGLSAILEGWFVSSGLLGCVIGVVCAGVLCDRIGRRGALMVSGALLLIAAVGCGVGAEFNAIVAFRILGGMGVGIASIASPLYISEISPPERRGRLVSLFQVAITLGIVAAMFVNAALQASAVALSHQSSADGWLSKVLVHEVWRAMFLVQSVPAAIFLLASVAVPESPRWLVLSGAIAKARGVLARLRSSEEASRQELDAILTSAKPTQSSVSNWRSLAVKRALRIGLMLAIFSELSGITVVMYFGPTILESSGATKVSSLSGHATIGVALAAFTLLAPVLVDRFGRRRVLLCGVAGAGVALATTGWYLSEATRDGASLVALLCLFVACFAFSIGPIKWIVLSEIFPLDVRAKAMGLCTVALWITDIVINQIFPTVRDRFGAQALFLGCAALLGLQLVLVYALLPETKGLSLEAVSARLEKAVR